MDRLSSRYLPVEGVGEGLSEAGLVWGLGFFLNIARSPRELTIVTDLAIEHCDVQYQGAMCREAVVGWIRLEV